MFQVKHMKAVVAAVAGGLALSACGGVASTSSDGDGETVKIRATNLLPPNNAQSDMMEWFLEELEKRTDGEVEADISYGGALVAGADTLQGLQQGRAEAGNLVPAYHPAELPLNNINMVPLPGGSQAARVRALEMLHDEVDIFKEEYEKNDIVLLGYLPNPSSTVAVSSDLKSLEDMKGLKIRTPSQPQAAVYTALGAEPVFMASEEVYEAVERGIVDGVTYPVDVQVSNGIVEVAKTMAPDVGQNGGSIFALSKATYDKLSDEAKDVVAELRSEWAAKSDEVLGESEAEACEAFLEGGGKIVSWKDAEVERLNGLVEKEAVGIWKTEAAKGGYDAGELDDLWTTYTEAVDEMASESDYTDVMATCGK